MTYKIAELSWTEYEKRLQKSPVLILPVGATEQHGPHLPMNCDAIFAEAVAVGLAERIDGLVMPTLSYGYKSQPRSGGGQNFIGTTSLDAQTLISMIRDILRELARHGATKVLIVNAHVENQWFITEGIDLALRDIPPNSMQIRRCEYWDFTPQDTLDQVFDGPFPGVDLEHAALLETSMMLALHPEWVDLSLAPENILAEFPPYDVYPHTNDRVPPSGVLAPTRGASSAKGHLLIRTTLDAMEATFKDF